MQELQRLMTKCTLIIVIRATRKQAREAVKSRRAEERQAKKVTSRSSRSCAGWQSDQLNERDQS